MKRAGVSRRVARRIGSPSSSSEGDSKPAVIKPPTKSKSRTKPSISLPSSDKEPQESSDTFKPRKSALSRAAHTNAALARARDDTSGPSNPFDRPSYTQDSLAELRDSTPKAPIPGSASAKELDLRSKFGDFANLDDGGPGEILSEAQIRERKDRRKRLALEQRAGVRQGGGQEGDDFISLETNEHGLARWDPSAEERYKGPQRLEIDEENIMEEADDGGMADDGRLAISRKQKKAEDTKRRKEIQAMIDRAEGGGSSSDDDDSSGSGSASEDEKERNRAFEAAQTAKGTGHEKIETPPWTRPRTPKIQPILELIDIRERLVEGLQTMKTAVEGKKAALAELETERKLVDEKMEAVQKKLDRTGEVYSRLEAILKEKREAAGPDAMTVDDRAPVF